MSRALATVREIADITPIKGADKIELAKVDGWQCVVRKGEFKKGDLCVYFEIDSILPKDKKWSAFMESRKYRVKTARFLGVLSQGIALPIESFRFDESYCPRLWDDVTEYLGVKKYDPQGNKERKAFLNTSSSNKRKKIPNRWLLKTAIGRKIHSLLYPRKRGGWPEWFTKTDEHRIQNIYDISQFYHSGNMIVTEKLDGCSMSCFYKHDERIGLFKKGLFGVCSRNVWYKTPEDHAGNVWCDFANRHKIKDALIRIYKTYNLDIAIQGELVGPNIQGNKYGLSEVSLYIFNIVDLSTGKRLSYKSASSLVGYIFNNNTPIYMVPVLPFTKMILDGLPNTLEDTPLFREEALEVANGVSLISEIGPVLREGVVVRDIENQHISFKVISNEWLLKHKE